MMRRKLIPVRQILACVAIAILCALGARLEPSQTSVAGFFTDTTIWLRANLFGGGDAQTKPSDAKVVVLAIDQKTLVAPPFKDVPRVLHSRYLAEAAQKALNSDAAVVAFDIVFAYDGPADIETTAQGEADEATHANAMLGRAISAYEKPFVDFILANRRHGSIILATTVDAPVSVRYSRFFTSRRGVAYAEVVPDADDVLRSVPAWLETTGDVASVPTLSGLARARIADPGGDAGWDALPPVQLAPPFSLLDLPTVSLTDLMNCTDEDALEQLFAGRVVLVGGAISIEDQVETADRFVARAESDESQSTNLLGENCPTSRVDAGRPGVFAHAAAIDGALRGWSPRDFSARSAPAILASFLIALAAALSAIYKQPWNGALITFVAIPALYLGASAWLLDNGYLLAFAAPILSAPAAFTISLSAKTIIFDHDKRRLRRLFSKYLAKKVIDEMADMGIDPKLGGTAADITILFADLSGFTKFSERYDPLWQSGVMQVLNDYLTVISEIIEEHGGYVDNFLGDAVMAIWNEPLPVENHSSKAVLAAIEIREKITKMAKQNKHEFGIKVGLERGTPAVGHVGSPNRLQYTAIGDVVNLASRLEGASGQYGDGVLVGPVAADATRAANGPQLLRLLQIRVKNRDTITSVFTPLYADRQDIVDTHKAALGEFEAGHFAEAARIWGELNTAIDGAPVPWVKTLIARAEKYHREPPEEWAGVVDLTEK